jgi:hypothetical protein
MIRFLFPGSVLVYLALLGVAWWFFGVPGIVGIVIILLLVA